MIVFCFSDKEIMQVLKEKEITLIPGLEFPCLLTNAFKLNNSF